jgi:hypothetical protein
MIGRHDMKWILGQLNSLCIPTLAPKSGGDDSVAVHCNRDLSYVVSLALFEEARPRRRRDSTFFIYTRPTLSKTLPSTLNIYFLPSTKLDLPFSLQHIQSYLA